MKYLATIALIIGLLVLYGTAEAARFDFTNGQPSTMDDGETSDTFEQTRYDFTNGQPSPVFDSTATEQAVASSNDGLIINNGGLIINNGGLIIR